MVTMKEVDIVKRVEEEILLMVIEGTRVVVMKVI